MADWATRIEAKDEGRLIRDGEVRTACEQACPTEAITFGDTNDPDARVTRLKADERDVGAVERRDDLEPAVAEDLHIHRIDHGLGAGFGVADARLATAPGQWTWRSGAQPADAGLTGRSAIEIHFHLLTFDPRKFPKDGDQFHFVVRGIKAQTKFRDQIMTVNEIRH